MDHTFIFTEDTDQLWFKEVAVRFPWQGAGSARARFGVKDAPDITANIGGQEDEAWILQDDYPHFAQRRSHFSCGKEEGEVAAGWCEATDQTSAITVAVADLARQFPKELAADRRGVTARLWSNRGGKELDYRPNTLVDDYYGNDWIGAMKKGPAGGEMLPCDAEGFRKLNPSALGSARTHFLFCGYHARPPDPMTSPRWAAAFDTPPAALADPARLCASGAGELPDPNRYQRGPLVIPKRQGDGTLTLGPWSGTYDEFRISKGMRYTQDFAPPTKPFSEDQNTVLLFHFDQNLREAGKASSVEFARQ